MGRSSRVRRSQEYRSTKVLAPQRTSPRSKNGLKAQPASTTQAQDTQLATPSSPSSSESHTEIAQEIVVWTEVKSPGWFATLIWAGACPFTLDRRALTRDRMNGMSIPPTAHIPAINLELTGDVMGSSLSALSESSDLSSVPSVVSSRATTPVEADEPTDDTPVPKFSQESSSPSLSASPLTDNGHFQPVSTAAPSISALSESAVVEPRPKSTSPPSSTYTATAVKRVPSESPTPTPITTETFPTPQPSTPSLPVFVPTVLPQSQGLERPVFNVRPKSSIPTDLSPAEYASQCIEGAENSRLNPFILHTGEYEILRNHLSYVQVTTYLNIRNGILRLWIRNPRVAVTREEAVGCAGARWANVASVCYDWLVRNGYINYGCLEFPSLAPKGNITKKKKKQKTIVVIGAGLAGLGCARQLEGLFKQYSDRLDEVGEVAPRVILLEGRGRVGGRVYSRPFQTKPPNVSPRVERCTAEMGGMIITGFIGNPLNILVRAQLGLPYHALNSRTTIFDYDGQAVEDDRDLRAEGLYNDCLDRVIEYKYKLDPPKIVKGNRELIMEARDACNDGQKTISQKEDEEHPTLSPQSLAKPPSAPKAKATAAEAARSIGWTLRPGISETDNLDLVTPTSAPGATLGSVVDSCIAQYKKIVDLTEQDFRLLNWHVANLEYSNATNMHNLSLGGWDIDAGNEWVGKHTMIVGGYQRVARGLLHCPSPLDIRMKAPVRKINYQPTQPSSRATVVCQDGSSIEADIVVSTIPLGVLKHGDVEFNPPLPEWKMGPIQRLGFGVLNKVILVYKQPFWDLTRHIFGVLRCPENPQSVEQSDYRSQRGRFFQFLDVTATSGLPCLVALMAGDAAVDTENSSDDELVQEATEVLRKIFGHDVPLPVEVTVARWARDRFARGSYSSSGPDMLPTDYDTMAKPVGNLYFAGEHTIGTHPATVHGAFMSGLRAAGEVLHSLIGDIDVPTPLLIPKESQTLKRKTLEEPKDPLDIYEEQVYCHIISKIGPRPAPPEKVSANAYRLYCTTNQDAAREKCQAGIRPGKRKGKAGPNEVRHMLSKMWKQATPDEKKPFENMAAELKNAYALKAAAFERLAPQWDEKAAAVRAEYVKEHPFVEPGMEGSDDAVVGEDGHVVKQRRKKQVSYVENSEEGSE
ncbi:hypothetical protein jhhlp_007121 [Lomentospora prolificans]|uniref:HMG box domain-containing protein n=1 Tax=Lomentospora prolificans TaxID=41688 RepID=A0A2N3N1S7_9PEZI|nr:hypothetical protein jhhlp_007121 [Lomentospora prolificans]